MMEGEVSRRARGEKEEYLGKIIIIWKGWVIGSGGKIKKFIVIWRGWEWYI